MNMFEHECSKLKVYCSELNSLYDCLQGKLRETEQRELENIETHVQLDAKLRALETQILLGKQRPYSTENSEC